jgi:hypothetical protein
MPLVAGVRCSFPGEDAGSAHIHRYGARLRTVPGGEQRGPAAQTVFRRTLLGIRPILFTHLVGSTERALALGDWGWHEPR